MTLQEALATGKKFNRSSNTTDIGDDFYSFKEFSDDFGFEREDVLATDWIVEPEASVKVTEALVATAWDRARAGSTSIKAAGSSEFYKKFLAQLKSLS